MINRGLFILLSMIFVGTGCGSPMSTNATLTAPTVQQEPTATTFIGIPKISTPLIQSDNESKDEFIVRIAATKITSERPFLIALSQMESTENLWQGVSPEVKFMDKCWMFALDSMKQCTNEDIQNNIGNQKAPKIFFAFAYSNSIQELFVLDYYRPWIENDLIDGYRLVLEFKDGKWVEESLTPVY